MTIKKVFPMDKASQMPSHKRPDTMLSRDAGINNPTKVPGQAHLDSDDQGGAPTITSR